MNTRYKLAPQLKLYDHLGFEWIPYLMFTQTKNYRSEFLNTDCYGLRFNEEPNLNSNQSIFDKKIINKKSVLIGGSTAFGVGSSSDQYTLTSQLSNNSNYHFYNLGGRAFSGFQEIILFQSLIKELEEIEKVVIFSGLNDLYFFAGDNFDNNFLGPFFFNKQFSDTMNYKNLSSLRKLTKLLLGSLISDKTNWNKITRGQLLKYFTDSQFRKELNNKTLDLRTPITLDDIVFRNLSIWSAISRGLGVKVYYFLQPFLGWGKDISKEEKEIIEYIDSNTKRHPAFQIMNKLKDLGQYYTYQELLKTYCNQLNIRFFDCNQMLKENTTKTDWLFVDRAHMNDDGYNLMSDYIRKEIE